MLNSGAIRASLDAGDITLGKIYEIHPFDNVAIYFETSGAALKQILAHSADKTVEIDDNKDYKIISLRVGF